MSIEGAIRLDIDELNATILVSSDGILDSCVECDAHMIEILSYFCRHFGVLFPTILWIRSTSEGNVIARCLDFIKESSVACNVQQEFVANGPPSAFNDSLIDKMVNVVDQVWAVDQTPAVFPLVIAGSSGWTAI